MTGKVNGVRSDIRNKRYVVTGPDRETGEFVKPSRLTLVSNFSFATFPEAAREAREYHEQFGDAFAVWFDDRLVAIADMRGLVMLCPDLPVDAPIKPVSVP